MPILTFSRAKQKIIIFDANDFDAEPAEGGLLITASGTMTFQDTPLLEELANHGHECFVTIDNAGETVVDDKFTVTFFMLEADQLAVRLN